MDKQLHIIYIPGLGDVPDPRFQLWAMNRWKRYGVMPEAYIMHWNDTEPWQSKFDRLLARIDELSVQDKLVGLVGASAGASVAVNAYAARQDKVVGVVLISGKVNRPEAVHEMHYTKNPALPPSVKQAVDSLSLLNDTKRSHILSRYGVVDSYVKKADSYIPGAKNQKVLTVGHIISIAFQLTFGAKSFIRFIKAQA